VKRCAVSGSNGRIKSSSASAHRTSLAPAVHLLSQSSLAPTCRYMSDISSEVLCKTFKMSVPSHTDAPAHPPAPRLSSSLCCISPASCTLVRSRQLCSSIGQVVFGLLLRELQTAFAT
jgi:hypothetical protein